MRISVPAVLLLTLIAAGCAEAPRAPEFPVLAYPPTPTVDVVDTLHGVAVADPYRWLEDDNSPGTLAWVRAQKALADSVLGSLPGRDAIRSLVVERIGYTAHGVALTRGDRVFFTRRDPGQDQSVLYVREGRHGEPRVLLDPSGLSDDNTVSIAGWVPSGDGSLVLWSRKEAGSDWDTWLVRDVASNADLPETIRWCKFVEPAWTPDDGGFFYGRFDEPAEGDELTAANYDQKLLFHRMGTPVEDDVLVYARPDHPEWSFAPEVTEDGEWLVIEVDHSTAEENDVYLKPLPDGAVIELLTGFSADHNFLGNDGPVFYFWTTRGAPRGRIVAVDSRDPAESAWREIVPESADVIETATMAHDEFVVSYMVDARNVLRRFGVSGEARGEIPLPGIGAVYELQSRRQDTEVHFGYYSFLTPVTTMRYDFAADRTEVVGDPGLPPAEGLVTEQVFYESADGTRIPMFLVHAADMDRDGANPTYLYGYGGFNVSMTPFYSTFGRCWIERGGLYAVANIRGGGEYGEEWHRAGMLENKQNSYDDFIAAAEWLIAEGWTSTPRLSVGGGSNGGTLVGAVVNQRPELFGAAVPEVGVMDMLRYEKFTIGWAWASDFGSVEDPEMFPVLRAYSPYHNIADGTAYPPTLVTTADHDDRVVPGHSFKYAARLQAAQGGPAPILCRIQTRAGHGAGTPISATIEEYADKLAFLEWALGVD